MHTSGLKRFGNDTGITENITTIEQLEDVIQKLVKRENAGFSRNEMRDILLVLTGIVDGISVAASGSANTHASATAVAASDTANPTVGEIQSFATGAGTLAGVIYYTGDNTADIEAATHIYWADKDGNVIEINPNAISSSGSSTAWRDDGNGFMVKDGVNASEQVSTAKAVGSITVTIGAGAVLDTVNFKGGASDLSSGELIVNLDYDASFGINNDDDDTIMPRLTIQNRTVVLSSDPFQQRDEDTSDGRDVFVRRFSEHSVAGRVSMLVTGLAGDFAVLVQV